MKARRQTAKQYSQLRQIIVAHEAAGDRAQEHHLYEDAAQHYQDARIVMMRDVQDESPVVQSRITEKLAYALLRGHNPRAAEPLFDQALADSLGKATEASRSVELLLQEARQQWFNGKLSQTVPILAQAVKVAETSGDLHLRQLAQGRMADYLLITARYREADHALRAMGKINADSPATIRKVFYAQKARLAAAFGKAEEAYRCFELAVSAAKGDADVISVASLWHSYGFWAMSLGNIDLARACNERALLIARQHHIAWLIADCSLKYAGCLTMSGQYGRAYEHLMNALAYNIRNPDIDNVLAEVGIPLALHMNDASLLDSCTRPSIMNLVFRSGQWTEIAGTAASFAHWHVALGRRTEAQRLLHRALEAVRGVEIMPILWKFPITVARFGAEADFAEARRFIEERVVLPCADVAEASLKLFDAFVCQARGSADAQRDAAEAVERFEKLGWHGYADVARTLVPAARGSSVIVSHPFSDLHDVLTTRKRQVAELVLRGLSNRDIAKTLAIAERTVEAHMTSIMSLLGVRSRHQLPEKLKGR